MKIAWIFLMKGGKVVWETEEKGKITNKFIIDTYLKPNGFVGRCTCVKEDTMYYEVDPAAMKMTDFYSWVDFLKDAKPIPSDVDIWRPFVWMDDYGWKAEIACSKMSFLEKFFDVLEFGSNGISVGSIKRRSKPTANIYI
jgi:hypothetical protein